MNKLRFSLSFVRTSYSYSFVYFPEIKFISMKYLLLIMLRTSCQRELIKEKTALSQGTHDINMETSISILQAQADETKVMQQFPPSWKTCKHSKFFIINASNLKLREKSISKFIFVATQWKLRQTAEGLTLKWSFPLSLKKHTLSNFAEIKEASKSDDGIKIQHQQQNIYQIIFLQTLTINHTV